jgi:hypothetical protein
MWRGRRGWAAIETPCGGEIEGQKLGCSTQDDGTAADFRHRRSNFSPNVEPFRNDAVRLAQLRHQHRTYGLNTWMIHGGAIVNHSRHALWRVTAVALAFRLHLTFAHERADAGRSISGEQNRHEHYRSCGSSRHFGKLYLMLCEMRKLGYWFHDPLLFHNPVVEE